MSRARVLPIEKAPIDEAPIDENRIVRELETILNGARDDGAWAPAIRAAELLGRHIGMWRSDSRGEPQDSLSDMIRQAAARRTPDGIA